MRTGILIVACRQHARCRSATCNVALMIEDAISLLTACLRELVDSRASILTTVGIENDDSSLGAAARTLALASTDDDAHHATAGRLSRCFVCPVDGGAWSAQQPEKHMAKRARMPRRIPSLTMVD
eukprot:CAMPEP_0203912900 /NCGR_PEP_ID=MMETSP0359-20131031/53942_1 /ASSEMBLY_ACC=CAM_ASM_000338 /TAXON_ID=268821 /ORGANISM="Scrippsiella Hangoei, Strain SHTV-5" /LENGTH=124 /DNA_ID=CAMNT_0050838923 /DNA_START=227 /DNA_END=602 /DNA_ORIENTATION=+